MPGEKPAPSPNKVLAVACCKLIHDKNGNTAFICRYPGCEKSYASRDAVRKHGRIHHLQWLRTLERVTTHEEEVVEAALVVRTQKRGGGSGGGKKKKAAADGSEPLMMPLNPFSPTMSAPQRVGRRRRRARERDRERKRESPRPQPKPMARGPFCPARHPTPYPTHRLGERDGHDEASYADLSATAVA